MNPTVVIALILVAAILAAWLYRGKRMNAPVPIITLGLVLSLGFYVIQHDRANVAQRRHDDCVARVERSLGNRVMWVDIGAYLAAQGLEDSAQFIQAALDRDLPLMTLDDCPKA
jgi:hypothetical protein